jgi:formylglycine-generating enzyme required for sulfatase activity
MAKGRARGVRQLGAAQGGVSARLAAGLCAALTMGACGASQEELASQAKAAADARAKAVGEAAKAEAAKATAAAEAEAAKLKAAANAAASKVRADADAMAATVRAAAAKLEETLPELRKAASDTQSKADAAAPALAKATAALDACRARAEQAAERAANASAATLAKLEAAGEACNHQVEGRKATCDDDCSEAESKCRAENSLRPNALDACDDTKDACQSRCSGTAVRACTTVWSQVNALRDRAPDATDPCAALDAQATTAGEASRNATEAHARLTRAKGEIAQKTLQADQVVAEAKSQADKLVAQALAHPVDFTRCGTLTRAFVPKGKVTLGETRATSDVDAFCMDTTEVTTAAYAACVASGKCTKADTGGSCNAGVAGRENHPINCVDWNQGNAYCEAQGQRLPTEEEWEYAATGGDGRTYPWGNDAQSNQLCWDGEGNNLGKGNRHSTCAVGSYPSGNSPFGLADMSGNVWEWTSTPYDSSARVRRGGCWYNDVPSNVRSASRFRSLPATRFDFLGFRCAGSSLP